VHDLKVCTEKTYVNIKCSCTCTHTKKREIWAYTAMAHFIIHVDLSQRVGCPNKNKINMFTITPYTVNF